MENEHWEIQKYVTPTGVCPFDKWFDNLDTQTQARIDVGAEISSQHLYRLLSGNGNPTIEALTSVLSAVGLTIDFKPVSKN